MKSPIAVFITDTHLKEDNIEVNKSIFRQATELVLSLGLSEIDHGGDIFNSRKAQTQVTLDAFDAIIDEAGASNVKVNVVVGNHDKTDYGSVISFVKQFRYHPGVTIHSVSGSRELTKDITLYYLSYFSEEMYISELKELARTLNPNKTNVLLTHIDINGGMMNNGIMVTNRITPSLFKPWDQVYVGHWHDQQILADGQIKFIGASVQHNYGELMGKGATVLYDDLSTELVPFKYPQFIKYEVSPKDLTKSDIEGLKAEKEASGDNIRIVLVGKESEVKSFNKQILIDAGVSVEHKQDEINKEELENRVEAFDMKSLKSEFETYCEKNNLDLATGMKYFQKVINSSAYNETIRAETDLPTLKEEMKQNNVYEKAKVGYIKTGSKVFMDEMKDQEDQKN